MNRFLTILILSLALFSCASGLGTNSARATDITFEKRKIQLGGKALTVEIADTSERREHGLMFRKSLPENQGMLFVFEDERPLAFWMMNTLIPLSIGYFDEKRKLIEVREMEPAVLGEREPKTYPSSRPAKYALEMPKGWFTRNKVAAGAVFTYVDKQ